jgi:hypothetical protein
MEPRIAGPDAQVTEDRLNLGLMGTEDPATIDCLPEKPRIAELVAILAADEPREVRLSAFVLRGLVDFRIVGPDYENRRRISASTA